MLSNQIGTKDIELNLKTNYSKTNNNNTNNSINNNVYMMKNLQSVISPRGHFDEAQLDIIISLMDVLL